MTKKVLTILFLALFLSSCKIIDLSWTKCLDRQCGEKCKEKEYLGGRSPNYDKEARIVECLCYPSEGEKKTFRYPFEEIDCKRKK